MAHKPLPVWDSGKGEGRRKGLLFNADCDKGRMRIRKHELCRIMGSKDRIQLYQSTGSSST